MFKRKLSKEAITALDYYNKKPQSIQWLGVDVFRIWYDKITEDGIELLCKDFQIKEL